jgi:glycine/D-amino acid oxidase-like deaminating enzyme
MTAKLTTERTRNDAGAGRERGGVSRRSMLKATAATLVAGGLAPGVAGARESVERGSPSFQGRPPHIVVIGAGAFGGWTALFLRRAGARVTLIDTWGPGNARASSGGELRITQTKLYAGGRMYTDKETYRPVYMAMTTRSTQLWKEHQERWDRVLYKPCGALGLYTNDNATGRESAAYMRQWGARVEELDVTELRRRYPQVNFEGVDWGLLDVDAGLLRARYACQEVFFFGTPADDPRYTEDHLPICSDATRQPSSTIIPGGEHRGMLAEGGAAPVTIIDPTTEERVPSAELAAFHREYLGFRYPGMKNAPLLLARVCQYENSDDRNFIVDRHPRAENVWLVGGGSGHGFKHGPAMGERVAATVMGKSPVDPVFGIARLRSG